MENINEIIEAKYNFTVSGIEQIKNAYKISTNEGYKCLKVSRYDFGQYKFIMEAIKHLINKGYDSVLHPYATRKGEDFIKLAWGYGYLCDWVDAREADFKNPVELKMCVDALSNLHYISREFTAPKESKGRNYYGKWLKKFKKRCDELLYFKALIKSQDKPTEFDKYYLKYFDIHYRQGLKTLQDIEGSGYFEIMEEHKKLSSLCHHDSANHNFLITRDLNIFLIDFDYCVLDTHLHDLASIIIRNLKYGHWTMDTMEFILDIYSNRIPVNESERYLLFCFMEFPQDFWQIGLQYYVEKQSWGEDFFIKKLHRIVEDSRDRMEFLKELETSFVEG